MRVPPTAATAPTTVPARPKRAALTAGHYWRVVGRIRSGREVATTPLIEIHHSPAAPATFPDRWSCGRPSCQRRAVIRPSFYTAVVAGQFRESGLASQMRAVGHGMTALGRWVERFERRGQSSDLLWRSPTPALSGRQSFNRRSTSRCIRCCASSSGAPARTPIRRLPARRRAAPAADRGRARPAAAARCPGRARRCAP